MELLFSIIIPTYNSEKTISLAIESILKQSQREFEILIMDGLSSDATLNILNKYDTKRIRILSEKDRGIYDAMNKGIELAKGEWLYFMGADDELFGDDVLLNISEEISKTKDLIIYGNIQIKGDCPWGKDGDIYDGQFNLKKLLSQNISHQAIFYNRKVFEIMGLFHIPYKINADWDFNLNCFSRLRFHYCDKIMALYAGGGISTASVDTTYYRDRLRNIVIYFQNKLYYDEFIEDRYAFRKMILKRDSELTLRIKAKLLISVVILQFKTWRDRFFGNQTKSANS